jgi:hypothetical protein
MQQRLLGLARAATAAGVNPKDVFCKEWPTIKTVLEWLQGIVPQPGPIIIKLVITAGDAAHSTICK